MAVFICLFAFIFFILKSAEKLLLSVSFSCNAMQFV